MDDAGDAAYKVLDEPEVCPEDEEVAMRASGT